MAEEKPKTLTELFTHAQEAMQARGVTRQIPSASNYASSGETNRRLLDSIFMKPHFMDPVTPDTKTTLFGRELNLPVFCSALSKPPNMSDEEMTELVRGMGRGGSMMTLGIGGSELLQAAIDTGTPVIKMVKPYRDTDLIYGKLKDAESRGCVAVGIDIDHFYGIFRDGAANRAEIFAPKETEVMRQAVASTKLPFIVKGVLSLQDAQKAVEIGAAAVSVSNHGAGSFDFGYPTIAALPEIVKAVGDKVTVLADTGFRTGNDVFKAVALGAKGVGMATSVLAASGLGAEGVELFLGFVKAELERTMGICGCSDIASIDKSLLFTSPGLKPWW